MEKLFAFFVLFLALLQANAQDSLAKTTLPKDTLVVYRTDSMSGGNFRLNLDKDILSSLSQRNKSKCKVNYKRPKKNTAKSKPTSTYDICRNQPKVLGYKIQIYYSKNRNDASRIRQKFAREFRGITPEMVYARPDYKVLVGDYFTKRSASKDFDRIKKKYPASLLVSWRVYCRKAK